jgi:hypothetical protein
MPDCMFEPVNDPEIFLQVTDQLLRGPRIRAAIVLPQQPAQGPSRCEDRIEEKQSGFRRLYPCDLAERTIEFIVGEVMTDGDEGDGLGNAGPQWQPRCVPVQRHGIRELPGISSELETVHVDANVTGVAGKQCLDSSRSSSYIDDQTASARQPAAHDSGNGRCAGDELYRVVHPGMGRDPVHQR